MSIRSRVSLVLGVIMIVLGVAVAMGPLLAPRLVHRPSITPSRWLDVLFAFFFIVRGVMNVRLAQRVAARESAGGPR